MMCRFAERGGYWAWAGLLWLSLAVPGCLGSDSGSTTASGGGPVKKSGPAPGGPAPGPDPADKPAATAPTAERPAVSANDGAANDGAAKGGAAKDGAAKDGAANDGAAKDGAAKDGAAKDGAAKDGAAKDGAEKDGAEKGGAGDERPATGTTDGPAGDEPRAAPLGPPNPFPHRIAMPEFPDELQWLNSKKLTIQELRGKFVLLDFWTYCCINCMHVLPELKKLEHAYPNQLVVIGVHSAKFDNEKITDHIAQAILRYEIEHPVVNDLNHQYWDTIGIRSWPTLLLIDPEGKAIWARAGEVEFAEVDRVMQVAVDYYRQQKLLDETPLRFELLEFKSPRTPLRYPGKVLADEAGGRLFISDSNHNRILITSLDGKLQQTIGTGQIGMQDGDYASCTFNHAQGMVLHDEMLYVADTENHLLRRVDLSARKVTTIAGVGRQGRVPWPGLDSPFEATAADETRKWLGPPLETALNSPWALWVHESSLYIAMAGPHQIWKMPLDGSAIGPYAGNGREDIVDGALLPERPYGEGSSFAQPSGLTSDGTWLYVADSEGSSIRAVPFDDTQEVRTVVGTAHLPVARLFEFGDLDGPKDVARLQHCLGVCYHEGQIYVADSYNHKIKVVNAETGDTRTLAGTGRVGSADEPAEFHEPSGLTIANGRLYVADTNNHLIRTVDLASGSVKTLELSGVEPPPPPPARKPDLTGAPTIEVPATEARIRDGQITLQARLNLPEGWKINDGAPLEYWVEADPAEGPVDRAGLGARSVEPATDRFEVRLPVSGAGQQTISLSLVYYYCETEGGLCKAGSVIWRVPLKITADAGADAVELTLDHGVVESP
jgi:thiol-disulfide isomerase/thioredoxin/DNA-binding beta-propeller fold protein YncE